MSKKEVAFASISDALDRAGDAINNAEIAALDLFIYDKEKAADMVVDLEHILKDIEVFGVIVKTMEEDFGKME